MLAVEESDTVSNEGLKLKAEVAVVAVVELALDFGVGEGLVCFQ